MMISSASGGLLATNAAAPPLPLPLAVVPPAGLLLPLLTPPGGVPGTPMVARNVPLLPAADLRALMMLAHTTGWVCWRHGKSVASYASAGTSKVAAMLSELQVLRHLAV